MDLPVCLIENKKDGKFQVNPKAIDMLSKIQQPLVVVAIVGLYRTGKSYLMNKLAGSQKGFDLGATVQAQTKGIWMRCVPHPTKESHTLVLLDTEGLGDVEKGDKKNDMGIFCLAVLLSSALVYNSKAVIDEDAIEKLHYVGELAELIKIKSKDNEDDEAEYSRFFPIFIWAVRDVTLKLEFNGKPITEDEYMENALTIQKRATNQEQVARHNRYRDCIRMYFKSRKCFMFDLPTGDKDVLQNMDEVSEDQLSPSFQVQTKGFCDYIYNNAQVKNVDNNRPVTGKILADLATLYTDAICSSNAACMEDVVTSISVSENTRAVKEATQHYEEKMKEKVKFPTETVDQIASISEDCEKEALKVFMKKSFRDNDRQFHKQFLEIIDQKKRDIFERNDAESRTYCKKLIEKFSEDLENAIKQGSYAKAGGYQIFKKQMERIEEEYNNVPKKGTKADEVLKEFKESKETSGIIIMKTDNTLSEQQKKIEEEKVSREKLELQKKMEKNHLYEENKKMELQRRILEENFREILEMERMEKYMLQEKYMDLIRSKQRERDLYLCQGFEEHAKMYQEQIHDLRRKKEEASSSTWIPNAVNVLSSVATAVLPPAVTAVGGFLSGMVKKLLK